MLVNCRVRARYDIKSIGFKEFISKFGKPGNSNDIVGYQKGCFYIKQMFP